MTTQAYGLNDSITALRRVVDELQDATNFDMFKGATLVGVISLMAWGLGYFGQPHILARYPEGGRYRVRDTCGALLWG